MVIDGAITDAVTDVVITDAVTDVVITDAVTAVRRLVGSSKPRLLK